MTKVGKARRKAAPRKAAPRRNARQINARRKTGVGARSGSLREAVVTAPVTVPYVRYSIRSAHWFAGRALAQLLKESGLDKSDVDGLSVGSFTLTPDTAIGLTQHLGVTVRWLDHVPLGGACGIV